MCKLEFVGSGSGSVPSWYGKPLTGISILQAVFFFFVFFFFCFSSLLLLSSTTWHSGGESVGDLTDMNSLFTSSNLIIFLALVFILSLASRASSQLHRLTTTAIQQTVSLHLPHLTPRYYSTNFLRRMTYSKRLKLRILSSSSFSVPNLSSFASSVTSLVLSSTMRKPIDLRRKIARLSIISPHLSPLLPQNITLALWAARSSIQFVLEP